MNVHIDFWTWRTFDKYLLTLSKTRKRPWIQQMISIQLTRRPLTRGEHFLGGTKACLIVQTIFCTFSKLAWTCREAAARLLQKANRVQGSLHVQGARLAVQKVLCTLVNSPGRTTNVLHGQVFEKFNLLIYWFQKSDITYPTLQMIKICPKRRFFDDKNDVFWLGLGFKI